MSTKPIQTDSFDSKNLLFKINERIKKDQEILNNTTQRVRAIIEEGKNEIREQKQEIQAAHHLEINSIMDRLSQQDRRLQDESADLESRLQKQAEEARFSQEIFDQSLKKRQDQHQEKLAAINADLEIKRKQLATQKVAESEPISTSTFGQSFGKDFGQNTKNSSKTGGNDDQ